VPATLPTPTCTHHQTTEIQCLTCRGVMRLITIEPGLPHFELRSYGCPQCGTDERFLMPIAPRPVLHTADSRIRSA